MSDSTITAPLPLLTTEQRGLETITYTECCELLRLHDIGRAGFVAGGSVLMMPVNYAFVAESIVFRATAGSKLASADNGETMSFEIDGWDRDERTGWSVLVKGTSEHVTDSWLTSMFEYLGTEPWANDIPRDNWVRIRSREITGRRILTTD